MKQQARFYLNYKWQKENEIEKLKKWLERSAIPISAQRHLFKHEQFLFLVDAVEDSGYLWKIEFCPEEGNVLYTLPPDLRNLIIDCFGLDQYNEEANRISKSNVAPSQSALVSTVPPKVDPPTASPQTSDDGFDFEAEKEKYRKEMDKFCLKKGDCA